VARTPADWVKIKKMSSVAVVSVEEYLSTSYRPDCDYVDGEIRERNLGEYEHANLQARLTIWFGNHEREWHIRVLVEQRIRVSARRYRIPDVCVLDRNQPIEPVSTRPPLIFIEILSKDDSLRDIRERVDDYLNFGVPHVWMLDPVLRKAYVCTKTGFQEPESGILEVAGSAIRVPLSEIFAELE
jgi:Uma2 family endonuclease